MDTKYLTKEEIIKIHDDVIQRTGGTSGIINEGMLDFVLEHMKVPKDIVGQALTLLFGIIERHPFVDGNKRTGLECTDIFLDYNLKNFKIKDIDEAEAVVLSIARGEASRNRVRKWIEKQVS